MRGMVIKHRPERHNGSRVDLPVALIIMLFDVIHHHGFGNARGLIQIAQVTG